MKDYTIFMIDILYFFAPQDIILESLRYSFSFKFFFFLQNLIERYKLKDIKEKTIHSFFFTYTFLNYL
jgi:hypothetical protein